MFKIQLSYLRIITAFFDPIVIKLDFEQNVSIQIIVFCVEPFMSIKIFVAAFEMCDTKKSLCLLIDLFIRYDLF